MATSFVQLNSGTGGAKAQTFQNTVGGNVVDANAVVLIDSAGNPLVSDTTGTGTITTTDGVVAAPAGLGAFVTGASTAGSLVAVVPRASDSIWNCQVTGLTTGTLWFEGSMDSTTGTDGNWMVLNAVRDGVLSSIVQQNATANGLYSGNVAGLTYLRIRSVGTLTGTPAIRWRLSSGADGVYLYSSLPPGTNALGKVETESAKATFTIFAAIGPAANPTDILTITGSATQVVKIKRITIGAKADTTAGQMLYQVVRRSTANTGGASSAALVLPHDTTDAALSFTTAQYTTNPTALGTNVGAIAGGYLPFPLITSGNTGFHVWDWSNKNDKAPTLRGTGQILAFNLNGAAVPAGGTLAITVEGTVE